MIENLKEKWKSLSKGKKITIISIPIIVIILLIAGFAYWFTSPTAGYSKYSSGKAKDAITSMDKKPITEDNNSTSSKTKKNKVKKADQPLYNQVHGVPSLDDLRELQNDVNSGKKTIIKRGNLSIPYLNIQVPIFEGTTDWTLSFGAGTAKPNQIIGKKNYAVSAHNFAKVPSANNFFFTHFQKLNSLPTYKTDSAIRKDAIGHYAYVAGAKHVYTYKIKEAKIVSWKDGYVIDDKMTKKYNNKPILTMTTCYEQSNIPDTQNPPYRIIMVGEQVKDETYKQFKDNHKESTIFEQATWLK